MISNRLKALLAQKGHRQADLADFVGVKQNTVSDWINKGTSPKIEHLYRIAEFFDVSFDYLFLGVDNLPPTLRGDEKRLLKLYNELDHSGRRKMMLSMFKAVRKNKEDRAWWETHQDVVEKLLIDTFGPDWDKLPEPDGRSGDAITLDDIENYPAFEADDTPYPVPREVPVYFQPTSAGTGAFLDSDDYDIMEFPFDMVPLKTTFGVRVSGDSMEPGFSDEDIVFVRQQPTLENSEIGVFMFHGEAYIKKLCKEKKPIKLMSLNTEYKPIEVDDEDALRVVGKVLGKFES